MKPSVQLGYWNI
jgi:glutathione S-transferase